MELLDAYPIVVTDKLAECRNFYIRWFGFQIAFEASWFVYLASTGPRQSGIAFLAADHPSQPPGPETFTGKGVLLTFQVADAAAEFERLREAGVPMAHPLRDEPWGQRRFAVLDPGRRVGRHRAAHRFGAGVLGPVHAVEHPGGLAERSRIRRCGDEPAARPRQDQEPATPASPSTVPAVSELGDRLNAVLEAIARPRRGAGARAACRPPAA